MTATVHHYRGRDGHRLAYRALGRGRPLVLLHGLLADGTQWLDHGPAGALAEHHRIVLPDLRGHGASARPHDAATYPPDVLADDGLALIDHLGLDEYDLGGVSLGGQIVLRMLVRGARPGRAVVVGQGIDTVTAATGRTGSYRAAMAAIVENRPLEPGTPEAELALWTRRLGNDAQALLHVLDSRLATAPPALRELACPVLVAVGGDDHDHAAADELAAALPDGRFLRVPGDHFSSLAAPELAAAIESFLTDPTRT
jgi:pimeloyl-ACP methyl ester carboxylesterase